MKITSAVEELIKNEGLPQPYVYNRTAFRVTYEKLTNATDNYQAAALLTKAIRTLWLEPTFGSLTAPFPAVTFIQVAHKITHPTGNPIQME